MRPAHVKLLKVAETKMPLSTGCPVLRRQQGRPGRRAQTALQGSGIGHSPGESKRPWGRPSLRQIKGRRRQPVPSKAIGQIHSSPEGDNDAPLIKSSISPSCRCIFQQESATNTRPSWGLALDTLTGWDPLLAWGTADIFSVR